MTRRRHEGAGYLFEEMDPDKKQPQPKPAETEERVHCQYCEDVGPCMFCDRGKAEAEKIKQPRR